MWTAVDVADAVDSVLNTNPIVNIYMEGLFQSPVPAKDMTLEEAAEC